MKKLLFLTVCLVAIMGYGGIISHAHAQSLTPAEAAALEQELAVAKASLIKLEMDNGMIPVGDSGTAPTPAQTMMPAPVVTQTNTISAANLAAVNVTLDSLKSTLATIASEFSSNPELAGSNPAGVLSTLQGIGNTLALIGNDAQGMVVSPAPQTAPVAMVQPTPAKTPVVAQANPATNPAPTTPATTPAPVTISPNPVAVNTAPSPAVASVPQTAQASSFWTFTEAHWPTITIIILIILILAILLWPQSEESSAASTVRVQTTSQNNTTKVSVSAPASTASPTPMATVVATSVPGTIDFQQTKVTVVRPPEQKKKTA